jgi:chaperonin GroEL
VKQITFSSEARKKLAKGISDLNSAVSVTLGPRGRNVVISQDNGVAITKDGVTVAKYFETADFLENVGAQMVKQVANKVAHEAGDGTTTATVLANAIFTEGNRQIEIGAHPMDLKKGIELGSAAIIKYVNTISRPIQSIETIKQVATISANNDEIIGQTLADTMEAVGFDGVITLGESKTGETFVEIVKGMQFQNGFLSPYFVNDSEKNIVEYEKPLVLLYDGKISNLQDILSFLELSNQTKRPLLIISESVSGEALNTLLVNKVRGSVNAAAVKAPGFGEHRRAYLQDIATLTGATLISDMDGILLKEATAAQYVGSCDSVEIYQDKTIIVGGHGKQEMIDVLVSDLKAQIAACTNESHKLLLKERLSKFDGGVAIIKIGATSELEAREKADRIDDALGATRAAVAEGIVMGGGQALVLASKYADFPTDSNKDVQLGIDLIRKAVLQPFITILKNAGIGSDIVLDKVLSGPLGYNAKTEEYVDMFEAGIIDPVKVTRLALENAVSIAGLLITTDCLMVKIPESGK